MAYQPYLISILTKVVRTLDQHQFQFALAGGLAYSALVIPRATSDIDFLILLSEKDPANIFRLLAAAFDSFIAHPAPMKFKNVTLWRAVGGADKQEVILDFLLAETDFHRSALSRKQHVAFADISLPIVTPEDLFLLKGLSNRPQDQVDCSEIKRSYAKTWDREYLLHWRDRLGLTIEI
ncbi:MAG: nucleotidyl transferase AbiEii/AbiGii toxin family protein [Nitrospirota bacterium]